MTTRRRSAAVLLTGAMLVAACSSSGLSTADFCEAVADLVAVDQLNLEASAVDDPAIRSGLERTANQFDEVADVAPDHIRPSVEVLAGLTRDLAAAIEATDPRDPFERAAAISAAQNRYADDLEGALETYNGYVAQNCAPSPE